MRNQMRISAVTSLALLCAAGQPRGSTPEIRTDDVDRFYALYDATEGRPSAEQLQAYLDRGSDGLLRFAEMRKTTGERIAQTLTSRPGIYADARKCAAALPAVKARLGSALTKLKELYPEASLPPVTIAVGRGKPVGTADGYGVMIGLEALCATDFMNPDVEDRFVYVIAHEYVHVQQSRFFGENEGETVLKAALTEGGAEFVGELIAGSVSYSHLPAAVKGHEAKFETNFLGDQDKVALGSAWLYNHPGTPEHPADLGYWIGYRIAKAYYRNASDKRAALRDIIELRDSRLLLARSGWKPGIKLE